jgi:hypothetical protein
MNDAQYFHSLEQWQVKDENFLEGLYPEHAQGFEVCVPE